MAFHTWRTAAYIMLLSFALLALDDMILDGQQLPNRLSVSGGVVNAINSTGANIDAHQPLAEGEKLRTGETSFASLAIANEATVTLGEKTHIEILRLGANPIIRLEKGSVKISSQHTDLQIMTRSGVFSAAEWPYAAELTVNEGGVGMAVSEGALRVSEMGTGLTVRSPTPTAYRTYVVGGHRTSQPSPVLPEVVYAPCASTASSPTGTPVASPVKPALTPSTPSSKRP